MLRAGSATSWAFYWIEGAPSANAAPPAVICPAAMCAAKCASVNGKESAPPQSVFLWRFVKRALPRPVPIVSTPHLS
jgi:hypothetical protein